jgi:hypothetical protein
MSIPVAPTSIFPAHVRDWNWDVNTDQLPAGIYPNTYDVVNGGYHLTPGGFPSLNGAYPRLDDDTMMWLTRLLQQRFAHEHGVVPNAADMQAAIENALLHDQEVFEMYQKYLEQMNGFIVKKAPFIYTERDEFEVERYE